MVLAGLEVEGEHLPRFLCYGVPVGCERYVKVMLEEKVEKIARAAERAVKVLAGEKQALWAVLRMSMTAQFEYWLQHCYPSDVKAAAASLDRKLWRILESCIGTLIPEGEDSDCVIGVPGASIDGLSFQQMVVRLPIKMGGLGIRNLEFLSLAAFISSVEHSIPEIGTITGLCPALALQYGGDTSFGKAMPADTRWRALLRSGCKLGQEFRYAWEALKGEAVSCSEWLAVELEGSLGHQAEGAGMGCETLGMRKTVVEQTEKIWSKVVMKCLEMHPDRRSRAVRSWPERDKLSSAWLLALPTGETAISSAEFAEAAAALLCLPSAACKDKIGCSVGDRKVDLYGDAVQAARMKGDGWRTRHDSVKMMLARLLKWAKVSFQCEVFNLFAHLIPQEGLSRLERGRKRQGLGQISCWRLKGRGIRKEKS